MRFLTMTLKEFIYGEDRTDGYHIYIVWKRKLCLYVGMSTYGICARWLNQGIGHLYQTSKGNLVGLSTLGKEIVARLPKSLKWTIELRDYGVYGDRLHGIEANLISKLHPALNIIYNISPTPYKVNKKPLTDDELESTVSDFINLSE